MRAHLSHPFLASARHTEPPERASVGARLEREVEQLKHVRINRVDRQSLKMVTRMEQCHGNASVSMLHVTAKRR